MAREFERPDIGSSIRRGARIAVGCGSRGVANYAQIARRDRGDQSARRRSFRFPAMGSHGAATAEGQRRVLEDAGITEDYVGAPLRASMDTIETGRMADATPVYADAIAAAADGIVLINRIKPHTTFRARSKAASPRCWLWAWARSRARRNCTPTAWTAFFEVLPEAARGDGSPAFPVWRCRGGERARGYGAPRMHPGGAPARARAELLAIAKERDGAALFDEIDVLIIDEMGKEISGTGFDST